ncbi:hypothetical protein SPHINGO8BC_60315 [Sphingobacterium multivorum]|uniref:Uncharacterized protein n=1 Tax=Sphingobacterium multivorum TaxID=28454 RepID=A0A654DHY0_SPHMU|nr:hypothetical protein SPHINGO8BC_60315 [Sphingobacterium multivorum]
MVVALPAGKSSPKFLTVIKRLNIASGATGSGSGSTAVGSLLLQDPNTIKNANTGMNFNSLLRFFIVIVTRFFC